MVWPNAGKRFECPEASATTADQADYWGLPTCFEAARVRQKANVFHERNHDAYKIIPLPSNASLRAVLAQARRK
jgi:hypothetical protein